MTKLLKFNANRKSTNLPYRVVAKCFLIYKNKLVAKEGPKFIIIPGGGADPGESPIQAGKREIMEEVGIILKKKLHLICSIKWDWTSKWPNTLKRKHRFMKFRGEHTYCFIGLVEKFIKPTSTEGDAWKGKKLLSFNKALNIVKCTINKSKQSGISNATKWEQAKLTIIGMLANLYKLKLLS